MSLLPDDGQSNVVQPQSSSATPPAPPAPSVTPAAAPMPEAPASSSKKKAGEAVSEAFSSLRVSLMPSDLEGAAGPDLGRRLLIFALVLVAETAALGVLYLFTTQAVSAATAKRDAVLVEIDKADRAVATTEASATTAADYAYQAQAAKSTLDAHLYWSNFFAFLEKRTRPGVTYNNFSGDAGSGTFTLEANALSYHDAAEQIVALREDPLIISVLSTSAAARIDDKGQVLSVSFTMVVKCKADVWKAPAGGTVPAAAGIVPTVAPSVGVTGSAPSVGSSGASGVQAPPVSGAPVVIPPSAPASGTAGTGSGQGSSSLFPTAGSSQPNAGATPGTP